MKLINTTALPDHFLRRLVSWCCKQLGMPVRRVREAAFRNGYGGGRAYLGSGRIGVRVRPPRTLDQGWRDDEEAVNGHALRRLVEVTAHEVAHLYQYGERATTRRDGVPAGTTGGSSAQESNPNHSVEPMVPRFSETKVLV